MDSTDQHESFQRVLSSLTHFSGTFQNVTHPKIASSKARLTVKFLWFERPSEKFSGKRASDDKTCWKDLCWYVGSVDDHESRLGCYKWYQIRPIPECGSGTNQAEAGGHVTPEADEGGELSLVHKTWQWAAPCNF